MPATTFPEYVQGITDLLNQAVTTGEAVLNALRVDQRSAVRGLIAGTLQFGDGSELHFREYVDMTEAEPKIMYACIVGGFFGRPARARHVCMGCQHVRAHVA